MSEINKENIPNINVPTLEAHSTASTSLNTKQTAKLIGLAEITVRNSRVTGLLCGVPAPKFRKIGRKVVYFKKDVDDWLNALPAYQNTAEVLGG